MKIYKEFPKDKPDSKLLDKVDFPSDLKRLDIHRQIYSNLNSEIQRGLHSIEIKILKN